MRAVETLTLLPAATVLFMWAILAHPTQRSVRAYMIRWVPARALRGDNSDRERRVARLTHVPL